MPSATLRLGGYGQAASLRHEEEHPFAVLLLACVFLLLVLREGLLRAEVGLAEPAHERPHNYGPLFGRCQRMPQRRPQRSGLKNPHRSQWGSEPYSATESYLEPYITTMEPYFATMEPYLPTMEPYHCNRGTLPCNHER